MELLRGMEVKITGVIHRLIFFFIFFFFFFWGGGGIFVQIIGGGGTPIPTALLTERLKNIRVYRKQPIKLK